MKNKFNLCNIYLLLWSLGVVQGFFFTSSFVSLLFSVPAMLISLYCFIKTITSFQLKGTIKYLCVFFSILLIYGIAAIIIGDYGSEKSNAFFLMTITSIGPIISFYYFSRNDMIDEKKLVFWFGVLLIISVLQYYDEERQELLRLTEENYNYDGITNNSSYYILGLFPFVFLFKKKPYIQYILVGIILFFVINGMKRGALIVAAFLLLWFINISLRFTLRRRKILILILISVLLIVGYNYLIKIYSSSNYFQHRIESTIEGSSSGRDAIYSNLWDHYRNNDNIIQLVFGEGAYATNKIGFYSAHNDWLELLIDCGFFTVFIYFIYWICFIRDWLKKRKKNLLIYSMFGACFIFSFIRSFFSMSFSNMPYGLCMIMGYCLAIIDSENSKIEKNSLKYA